MELAQLSFLTELVPDPPKPLTVWETLAAGLAASEMKPVTRDDARRAREIKGRTRR
jgi:hypothetical protein